MPLAWQMRVLSSIARGMEEETVTGKGGSTMRILRIFLSYHFERADELFAQRLNYYLRSQPKIETFFWPEQVCVDDWQKRLCDGITQTDAMVFVLGRSLGDTQVAEAKAAADAVEKRLPYPFVLVRWSGRDMSSAVPETMPRGTEVFVAGDWAEEDADLDRLAHSAAMGVVSRLSLDWSDPYEIPIGYPFDYEKDIIDDYVSGEGAASREKRVHGAPPRWPSLERVGETMSQEPNADDLQREVGRYRADNERIAVDARLSYLKETADDECRGGGVVRCGLDFAEAGPRQFHVYPRGGQGSVDVGIIVSGGIAPGINAVIRGILERHQLYARRNNYALNVSGCVGGLQELLSDGSSFRCLFTRRANGEEPPVLGLSPQVLDDSALAGGSILPTSRADDLLDVATRQERVQQIVAALSAAGMNIVYVIGGDGSMRAAHCIWREAQQQGRDISVVAVPKTTDNDILWVWQSFGFLSGVEKAREEILNLHTEARSNPRLGVIQLFGSDSGYVVSHAALASGVCDLALIPEVPFSMERVCAYIRQVLDSRYSNVPGDHTLPWGIVVMAETAIPEDVQKYVDQEYVGLTSDEKDAISRFVEGGRRVQGQTPDELRSGGLKVVSRVLEHEIQNGGGDFWPRFRIFTNEPRHLLRSIAPSLQDLIFGQRLGMLAVDNALAGYTDFMISQWLTEYVLVPLRLVILGRKRVPPEGIFWKSVLAATGQPADLT